MLSKEDTEKMVKMSSKEDIDANFTADAAVHIHKICLIRNKIHHLQEEMAKAFTSTGKILNDEETQKLVDSVSTRYYGGKKAKKTKKAPKESDGPPGRSKSKEAPGEDGGDNPNSAKKPRAEVLDLTEHLQGLSGLQLSEAKTRYDILKEHQRKLDSQHYHRCSSHDTLEAASTSLGVRRLALYLSCGPSVVVPLWSHDVSGFVMRREL